MKWHILALTLIAVVGVVFAAALVAWRGGAEFTAQEEAMLEKLPPILDTLVLHEEDLSSLSGDYEVCGGSGPYGLNYGYRSQDGSAEVEEVEAVEASGSPYGSSLFCDFESGAFVSSLVELPETKDLLLALNAINRDLARAQETDLEKLAEATSGVLLPEEELLEYRSVSARTLGHARYAWVRTVDNLDTGEQFEIYHFDFNRSVVMAGLLVKLPSSPTAEEEASFLASVFDNKIAAQLELLRPEVQAQ